MSLAGAYGALIDAAPGARGLIFWESGCRVPCSALWWAVHLAFLVQPSRATCAIRSQSPASSAYPAVRRSVPVIAIHLGLAQVLALALPIGGLLGALLAMLAVIGLSGARGGPVTLILAGLAVSAFATALISLALNLSANPFASVEMVFWMMGSLADRSLTHVFLAAPLIALGLWLLIRAARALDALTLGEDAAQSLGIDLGQTRLLIVAGTALAVGAATAVTGVIGFVG